MKTSNIQLSNKIRRFFQRMGGGNVKALGYNTKGVLPNGGDEKGDFSTQLKEIVSEAQQAISENRAYFKPNYTVLFGPNCFDDAVTEEQMSVLTPGTTLTLEQAFIAENYDFLRLLFGIKDITTWFGFDSWGSGAPKSILGVPGEYIVFSEGQDEIKTRLNIQEYYMHNINIAFPNNFSDHGIQLSYDIETETFTVIKYGYLD